MFTPYRFNAKHNSLLFYAKSKGHKLNEVTETITRDEYVQMKKQQIHIAEDGREWIWGGMQAKGRVMNTEFISMKCFPREDT